MKQKRLPKHDYTEIGKLLKSLLEICQICHMPMFACFAINEKEGMAYKNIIYSAQSHSVRLYNDRVRKHMLVANNFEVISQSQGKEKLDEGGKKYTRYEIGQIEGEELNSICDAIVSFAKERDIAVFFSIAIYNKDGETRYKSFHYLPEDNVFLNDNKLHNHILVETQEFDVVPQRDSVSMDIGEVLGFGE